MRPGAASSGDGPQTGPGVPDGEAIATGDSLAGIFRELAAEAASAVGTYNLSPELILEKICAEFTQRILERNAA
jgi:hypothetical protein